MRCAWEELLKILPAWIRSETDQLGKETLQELRLRLGEPPELVLDRNSRWITGKVSPQDLDFCIHAASRYSPWSAETISEGFLTAPGGHRIGLCGTAADWNGRNGGLRRVESLCIRVARDFPGIAGGLDVKGSLLILGPPGWGKTTLLRDLIRQRSRTETVAVVDERGELFPAGITRGHRMDVLTGERKSRGILRLLRTMGPQCIAVDEITAREDRDALCQAAGCGVSLLATAHGNSLDVFCSRPDNAPLVQSGIFDYGVILNRDWSYRTERMKR